MTLISRNSPIGDCVQWAVRSATSNAFWDHCNGWNLLFHVLDFCLPRTYEFLFSAHCSIQFLSHCTPGAVRLQRFFSPCRRLGHAWYLHLQRCPCALLTQLNSFGLPSIKKKAEDRPNSFASVVQTPSWVESLPDAELYAAFHAARQCALRRISHFFLLHTDNVAVYRSLTTGRVSATAATSGTYLSPLSATASGALSPDAGGWIKSAINQSCQHVITPPT